MHEMDVYSTNALVCIDTQTAYAQDALSSGSTRSNEGRHISAIHDCFMFGLRHGRISYLLGSHSRLRGEGGTGSAYRRVGGIRDFAKQIGLD